MTNIKLLKVGETLPINEKLAGIVPMAIEAEQAALTADIRENGLRDPIVLWKGEIVDGRCRQIACTLAGVPVMARELDNELTESEVTVFVKSVNTRRNLTVTQKIMIAAKEASKPGGRTNKQIADAWGISERVLGNAKYIMNNAPEYVEPLFNGMTVEVYVQRGFSDPVKTVTDKVSVVAKAVKLQLERDKLVIDHSEAVEWNPDSQIKLEAGKQWYAEVIEECKVNPVQFMIELANYKFRLAG